MAQSPQRILDWLNFAENYVAFFFSERISQSILFYNMEMKKAENV